MNEPRYAREVAENTITLASERAKNPAWVWGYSWGPDFPALDRLTHGIHDKKLMVMISRPGGGKSALLGKILVAVARQLKAEHAGRVVRLVTLEMSAEDYQLRLGAAMADVAIARIESGYATADQRARFIAAQKELASLPIEYLEYANSLEEIERFVRREGNCALWGLDHVGLTPGIATGQNIYSSIAQSSIRLSRLAHSAATGIILGHQNREGVKQADKRPTGEHVAGSDQITKDADVILGIYREDMWMQLPAEQVNTPKPGELILIKVRGGSTGTVYAIFDPRRTDWKENLALNKVYFTEEAEREREPSGKDLRNGRKPAS